MVAAEVFVQSVLAVSWGYVLSGIGLFVVTFVVSIVVIAFLLVRLPTTFFLDSHNRDLWIDQHPVLRWSGIVLKNLLGIGIIVVGVLLSLPGIPGQGILTILIGLVLIDFPGKRRMERAILRRPGIFDRVNRLRGRFGRPPLVVVEPSQPEDS